MITNYDGEAIEIPQTLPMLPVRDIVVYPYMIIPLFVGRESSIMSVEDAMGNTQRLIFLSSQKNIADEQPSSDSIYEVGTVAMIMRMRKLPDGRVKILTQGLCKARVKRYTSVDPYYKVEVEQIPDLQTDRKDDCTALMRTIKEQIEKVMSLGKVLAPDIMMVLEDIQDPSRMADLVASNLGLKVAYAQEILECLDPFEKLKKVSDLLAKEIDVLNIQAKIRSQTKDEITKTQKEYFLREQIKQIKNELGDGQDPKGEEVNELREKVMRAKMPVHAEQETLKQIQRLERMHPESSEASMLRTYIDWMIDTPWSKQTEDHHDLNFARKVLDEDHYKLEKVKERVLEFLAVRKLKNNSKGPILCLSGPPGVGKTSLGKSIAKSLGREFVRISLGGVKDEAEVRGHRRTYVGALPGRIIQGLKTAGTNNPVMVLDEIDKLASDYKGDPASALLEVLDPEQNHSFRDHYLNVNIDLSSVIFIATCNVLENIPGPLRDRMEVIPLSGYTQEEKFFISKKYLIGKQTTENGLQPNQIDFRDEGITEIVNHYTREAGLRNLERLVGSVCRKTARLVAEGKTEPTVITKEQVHRYLGPPIYLKEDEQNTDEVGICTGLAWTSVGGEILYVETTVTRGKGHMTLTGQLGDVMKESGQAALGLIRWRAQDFGIHPDHLAESDLHVHFPQGAIPKDGPSAGITMATALISRLTGIPVRKDVAMTGEITLTGRVLPIGGLKEKALAAMRHGIKTVVIPEKNKKDLEEIPEEYRKELEFITAKSIDDVLAVALTQKVTPLKVITPGQAKPEAIDSKTTKPKRGKSAGSPYPAVASGRQASAKKRI